VYSIIFTQAARTELIEAQDWYEGEATGVGRRFRLSVNALIERMADKPRQFPIVFKNVHRRLPYHFLANNIHHAARKIATRPCQTHSNSQPLPLAIARIEPLHPLARCGVAACELTPSVRRHAP